MSEEEQNQPEVSQTEDHSEVFLPWKGFLESFPLNTPQKVSNYYYKNENKTAYYPFIRETPILRLHCSYCQGIRNFEGKWTNHAEFNDNEIVKDFIEYICRDCKEGKKPSV